MNTVKVLTHKKPRLLQGDIISNVEFIESADQKGGVITISKIKFPNVVVLTQDCDLQQDHSGSRTEKKLNDKSQDKRLFSVLVAPLYNLEHVYAGEHLSELGWEMAKIKRKKTPDQHLRNNMNPRFHYLHFESTVPLVPSVVDFKHYFSVKVETLKTVKRKEFVCQLAPLFREDLSQRFAAFLSRIGLPEKREAKKKGEAEDEKK